MKKIVKQDLSKDKELEKIIDDLLTKSNNVTSDDGKVTIYFTGVHEYTDIKINCFLEETTKEELEADIISVLDKSMKLSSSEFADSLINYVKKKGEEMSELDENDDVQEDLGVQ